MASTATNILATIFRIRFGRDYRFNHEDSNFLRREFSFVPRQATTINPSVLDNWLRQFPDGTAALKEPVDVNVAAFDFFYTYLSNLGVRNNEALEKKESPLISEDQKTTYSLLLARLSAYAPPPPSPLDFDGAAHMLTERGFDQREISYLANNDRARRLALEYIGFLEAAKELGVPEPVADQRSFTTRFTRTMFPSSLVRKLTVTREEVEPENIAILKLAIRGLIR